jgi:hypothetical protein
MIMKLNVIKGYKGAIHLVFTTGLTILLLSGIATAQSPVKLLEVDEVIPTYRMDPPEVVELPKVMFSPLRCGLEGYLLPWANTHGYSNNTL